MNYGRTRLVGLLGVIAGLAMAGCGPSEEETLDRMGYQLVGTVGESSVWVSKQRDEDGAYGIEVAGKLRGLCNGSVLAGIGTQICNMGQTERGSLYMVGAPPAAVSGTITLTNGRIMSLQAFDLPQQSNLKLAAGTSASDQAQGFIDVEFITADGTVLDRGGNRKN